jgi:hypothetical protein
MVWNYLLLLLAQTVQNFSLKPPSSPAISKASAEGLPGGVKDSVTASAAGGGGGGGGGPGSAVRLLGSLILKLMIKLD